MWVDDNNDNKKKNKTSDSCQFPDALTPSSININRRNKGRDANA